MKLTPFESSIERVAVRILGRHKKELEAYITLAYQRAVGQAVEFLEAKTSPAKKANATRQREKAMRDCLRFLEAELKCRLDDLEEPAPPWTLMCLQRVQVALEVTPRPPAA